MKPTTRKARSDGGFTLVELLIVVAIMGLLTSALALALMAMLRQTETSQSRVEVSSDSQIAAAYFAEDVASVGVRDGAGALVKSVETNVGPTSGTYQCGAGTLPNASVRLAWNELTDGSTEVSTRVVVSYVVVPNGTQKELHRYVCRGTSTTPVSSQVVMRNVSATVPTVACTTPTTCDASTPPKSVSLNVTLTDPKSLAPLTVALSGQRRQTA